MLFTALSLSLSLSFSSLSLSQVLAANGPRRLERQIHTRRTKGLLMPFTVDVFRGRALALTHFPRDVSHTSPSKRVRLLLEDGSVADSSVEAARYGYGDADADNASLGEGSAMSGMSGALVPWDRDTHGSHALSALTAPNLAGADAAHEEAAGGSRPPTASRPLGRKLHGDPRDWRTYLAPGDIVYIKGGWVGGWVGG